MASFIKYFYRVKIISGAAFIADNCLFAQGIQHCEEITIKSKMFSNFDDCRKTLTNLMNLLSIHESYFSNVPNTISTETNPGDSDEWHNTTILRIFCNSEDSEKTCIAGQIDAIDDPLLVVKHDKVLPS